MAAWPGTLPQIPEPKGYSEELQDQTLRSTVDAGPPKIRRRFTAAYKNLRFNMLMTSAQLVTLDTFFNSTQVGGSLAFTFNDPITQVVKNHRFTKPYKVINVGGDNYVVNFEFEQLP